MSRCRSRLKHRRLELRQWRKRHSLIERGHTITPMDRAVYAMPLPEEHFLSLALVSRLMTRWGGEVGRYYGVRMVEL